MISTPANVPHAPAAPGFDYGVMAGDLARDAKAVAARIIASQEQHVALAVEAGKALASVKDRIDHGQWLPWLEQECRIDKRTAQRYMATAEAFGDKYVTVTYLPMRTVYALAAPQLAATRSAIVDEIESGAAPSVKDIETRLCEAREAAKAKAKRETPAARQERIAREKRQEQRENAKRLREAKERVALRQAMLAKAETFAVMMLDRLTPSERSEFATAFADNSFPISQGLWEALVPSRKSERELSDARLLADAEQRYGRG